MPLEGLRPGPRLSASYGLEGKGVVLQAVNSGILGGFSAFDVRALSEGHHQELQRLRNARAQQAAQAAAVSQQQQQQVHAAQQQQQVHAAQQQQQAHAQQQQQQLLQQQLLRQSQVPMLYICNYGSVAM